MPTRRYSGIPASVVSKKSRQARAVLVLAVLIIRKKTSTAQPYGCYAACHAFCFSSVGLHGSYSCSVCRLATLRSQPVQPLPVLCSPAGSFGPQSPLRFAARGQDATLPPARPLSHSQAARKKPSARGGPLVDLGLFPPPDPRKRGLEHQKRKANSCLRIKPLARF